MNHFKPVLSVLVPEMKWKMLFMPTSSSKTRKWGRQDGDVSLCQKEREREREREREDEENLEEM